MYSQFLLELLYIEFQKHLFIVLMDTWQLSLRNYNVTFSNLAPYFIVMYYLTGSAIFFSHYITNGMI